MKKKIDTKIKIIIDFEWTEREKKKVFYYSPFLKLRDR